MKTVKINGNNIEIDGYPVVCADRTPRGWRWFCNAGRSGKKIDFPTSEAALKAAAKTLGIKL